MTKPKPDELNQQIAELTMDLQRVRADFENYRKRVDDDLARARQNGEQKAIAKILPILDIFDAIFAGIPDELRESDFGRGVVLAEKNLAKTCDELNLKKLEIKVGDGFNHETMNAIQFDENSAGETEIVAEILQNGYVYDDQILRPAMVRVTRR